MRLFVLGASGGVGRCLLEQGAARGHAITAQSRSGNGLVPGAALHIATGEPTDAAFLRRHMASHDAVA
ncbi:MAG: NAD(P)H-binding protein, partial [Alishewanella aestuarii]